ncbi:hypothetical protein HQ560_12805 [bacterium]|nr:hypothetical protein [bacterium]
MERASRTAPIVVLAAWVALLAAGPAPAAEEKIDPIQGRIDLIKDMQQTDDVRSTAALQLVKDVKLSRSGGLAALLALGKDPPNENVSLQVAVALSHLRGSAGAQMAQENLALSTAWLVDGKDNALRYWAANLVAKAQSQAAADTLGKVLETLDPKSERGLRSAVVTAMSTLEGGLGAKAEEALLKLTHDPLPELRIEGIEGLRKRRRKQTSVPVIDRLLEMGKTDKVEAVWRAAVLGLREVVPGSLRSGLNIPAGASEEERQSILKTWERRWLRVRPTLLAAQPKPADE